MKKFIIYLEALCLITCLLLMLSSCSEKNSHEEIQQQTKEIESKELADPALIPKIKEGMSKTHVESILGTFATKLSKWYVAYRFTDGRVVYVGEKGNSHIVYDYAVDPNLVDQIKTGDHYDVVTQKLGAEGISTSDLYWTFDYCLSDGRCLTISFFEDKTVQSITISSGGY